MERDYKKECERPDRHDKNSSTDVREVWYRRAKVNGKNQFENHKRNNDQGDPVLMMFHRHSELRNVEMREARILHKLNLPDDPTHRCRSNQV